MIWAVNRYVQRYQLTDRPLASNHLWSVPWILMPRTSHYYIIKIIGQLDNNKSSSRLYIFYIGSYYWSKCSWWTICRIRNFNITNLNLFIIKIWISSLPWDQKYIKIIIYTFFGTGLFKTFSIIIICNIIVFYFPWVFFCHEDYNCIFIQTLINVK